MKQEVIQKAPEQVKKPTPNMTGIPTQMKLDFERRSGLSFDDVRVHYNSDKPAKIGALAYTQGTQVHVGPGQEKHLRHELGHVVQQKQGIVRPTIYFHGHAVNLEKHLETQANQPPSDTFSTTVDHEFRSVATDFDVIQGEWIKLSTETGSPDRFMWDRIESGVIWICEGYGGDALLSFISRDGRKRLHEGEKHEFAYWKKLSQGKQSEGSNKIIDFLFETGGGMNKQFFSNRSAKLAWIQPRERNPDAVTSERSAIDNLLNLSSGSDPNLGARISPYLKRIFTPQDMGGLPMIKMKRSAEDAEPVAAHNSGGWTENIVSIVSFKPKFAYRFWAKIVSGLSKLGGDTAKTEKLISGLNEIRGLIPQIAHKVGEIEIIVENDGSPFILDIAKEPNGTDAKQDVEAISEGIKRVIEHLGGTVK